MRASSCPYLLCLEGMVNCVTTNFAEVRRTYNVSSSVDGKLDPPWCHRTNAKSKARIRKAHKLQHMLYLWVSPANSHILEGTSSMKYIHIFSWASYCIFFFHCYCHEVIGHHCWYRSVVHPGCIPTCDHTGHQGDMRSKFTKCVLFSLSDVNFWLLWKRWWCTALFCFVLFLYCIWHIWNWVNYLITVTVFVLDESRDRE